MTLGEVLRRSTEYLERKAAFDQAVETAQSEYDGDPADAEHEAEEQADIPAARQAEEDPDKSSPKGDPSGDEVKIACMSSRCLSKPSV